VCGIDAKVLCALSSAALTVVMFGPLEDDVGVAVGLAVGLPVGLAVGEAPPL
jgi:hypothetical protein